MELIKEEFIKTYTIKVSQEEYEFILALLGNPELYKQYESQKVKEPTPFDEPVKLNLNEKRVR